MSRTSRLVLVSVVVGLVSVLLWQGWGMDAGAFVEGLAWLRAGGPKAMVVFGAGYALATWLMAPASWLQGTAGFLFGPLWGIVVASTLSTTFGTVSFLLARTVLRDALLQRFAGRRLHAIDEAVREGGLGLVVLLRLSPISPYNVVNYVLGLTGVRLRDYVLGTWLGSLLPVTLYAYVGSTVSDLGALLAGEAEQPSWVRWFGLALTVVVTMGVTRFAKTTLQRHLHAEADPPTEAVPRGAERL